MSRELVEQITEQTKITLHNVDTALQTCDLSFELCHMPVWKHIYHTLHSLDRWFINPERYEEPPFHEPNLNSLDVKSERVLSREELSAYFETVKDKLFHYLDSLTNDMLAQKPEGCAYTRMALILGQYRHTCSHLGNINCVTIIQTGKWPRVVGMDGDFSKGLYE